MSIKKSEDFEGYYELIDKTMGLKYIRIDEELCDYGGFKSTSFQIYKKQTNDKLYAFAARITDHNNNRIIGKKYFIPSSEIKPAPIGLRMAIPFQHKTHLVYRVRQGDIKKDFGDKYLNYIINDED